MELAPGSQLSEKAEQGFNRLTTSNFRKGGGGINSEAVGYFLQALQLFENMAKSEVQKIAFEIATLGAQELSVKDSSAKHSLRSLPGEFCGLHLLCPAVCWFPDHRPYS